MIVSRYHVATPPFLDRQDGIAKRVVFATRTAEWRAIDAHSWDRIQQGDLSSIAPPVLQDLLDIELLVPADEDELATIVNRNLGAIDEYDVLSVTVEPTALCQLNCDYCGQEHESRGLSADDQTRLICRTRGLLQSGGYRTLKVSWFGTEPLLGLNVIRALTPRFRELATEFGCEYASSITTNGLALSDAIAAELVTDLGIKKFLISLDGPAEFHDARRPTKDGRGTFERIFANTVSLARREDLDADVTIRCNVDRRNVEGVSRLIQALSDAGALNHILDFFVGSVHDWGNDAGSLALPKEEFAEQEIKWLAELAALGFVSPRLIPRREAVRCMAVMRDAFLVDPYGQVFNCVEPSLVPAPPPQPKAVSNGSVVDKIGQQLPILSAGQLPILSSSATYALGDLTNGDAPERRQLLGNFNERVARGEFACSSCRMLPVCGGGCPKHWLEGGVPCPSAKFNIESRLLLGYAISRLGADASQSIASQPL